MNPYQKQLEMQYKIINRREIEREKRKKIQEEIKKKEKMDLQEIAKYIFFIALLGSIIYLALNGYFIEHPEFMR